MGASGCGETMTATLEAEAHAWSCCVTRGRVPRPTCIMCCPAVAGAHPLRSLWALGETERGQTHMTGFVDDPLCLTQSPQSSRRGRRTGIGLFQTRRALRHVLPCLAGAHPLRSLWA